MGAVTRIGPPRLQSEPADQPPVEEALDDLLALVEGLGRDLAADPVRPLPPVLVALPAKVRQQPGPHLLQRLTRVARPGWLEYETLYTAILTIVGLAIVVALEFLLIDWSANR